MAALARTVPDHWKKKVAPSTVPPCHRAVPQDAGTSVDLAPCELKDQGSAETLTNIISPYVFSNAALVSPGIRKEIETPGLWKLTPEGKTVWVTQAD